MPPLLHRILGFGLTTTYGLGIAFYVLGKWLVTPARKFWGVQRKRPAILDDPAIGRHGFKDVQSEQLIKLHYVEQGDKTKPLMLLVHGFPEFWYTWRHQLKEFSSDYWVVAMDMRGYGDSDKPADVKSYKIYYIVEDIKKLVAALGRTKCTLVAHDWGGIIAWYLILQYPHIIDSYIIMNSVHPVGFYNVLHKSLSQFMKSWYIFFFQNPYLPEIVCSMNDFERLEKAFRSKKARSPITDEDLEAYKYVFGRSGALTHPINYYRANFMMTDRDRLKNLGKNADFPPGLILYGEDDAYLGRATQEESVKMVANATLVTLPGVNHFLQQDAPAEVNRAMRTFLSELKRTKP